MTDPNAGRGAFEGLRSTISPHLRQILGCVNALHFTAAHAEVDAAHAALGEMAPGTDDEETLNQLFVIRTYVDIFAGYTRTWERIVSGDFAESWSTLQDGIDRLRTVKRHSDLPVEFWEDHLFLLEEAYPYRLFASIGAVASHFECSICGLDIDGDECGHRRSQLYSGRIAYGIARELVTIDHVSLTTNPDDKRCVIIVDDANPQFDVLRYLAKLVTNGELAISDFGGVTWSDRNVPNPAFVQRGRNQVCFCGSGRKFKKCCIGKETVQRRHAEIQRAQRDLDAIGV